MYLLKLVCKQRNVYHKIKNSGYFWGAGREMEQSVFIDKLQ